MVGNKVEFHKIYQQYHPSLMSYASAIVNTDAAEDIVQDTFLYVWEHWESLSATRNIKAYLYSIVYSRCIDYLRKTAMIGRHIVSIKTDDNKEPESEYEKQIPEKRLLQTLGFPDETNANQAERNFLHGLFGGDKGKRDSQTVSNAHKDGRKPSLFGRQVFEKEHDTESFFTLICRFLQPQ